MVDHEPGDRRMIGHQPAADHPERRIGLAVRLDPPTGTDPAAIRVPKQRQHHLRLIRRPARTPTRPSMQTTRVQLANNLEHEKREMPFLKPIAHAHRHQEQLIPRRAHIHPRRPHRPDTTIARIEFRRPIRHHQHHLLTQAPAAPISRKSPAQEVFLSVAPDRNPAFRWATFPETTPRHPGFATASRECMFLDQPRVWAARAGSLRSAVVTSSQPCSFCATGSG